MMPALQRAIKARAVQFTGYLAGGLPGPHHHHGHHGGHHPHHGHHPLTGVNLTAHPHGVTGHPAAMAVPMPAHLAGIGGFLNHHQITHHQTISGAHHLTSQTGTSLASIGGLGVVPNHGLNGQHNHHPNSLNNSQNQSMQNSQTFTPNAFGQLSTVQNQNGGTNGHNNQQSNQVHTSTSAYQASNQGAYTIPTIPGHLAIPTYNLHVHNAISPGQQSMVSQGHNPQNSSGQGHENGNATNGNQNLATGNATDGSQNNQTSQGASQNSSGSQNQSGVNSASQLQVSAQFQNQLAHNHQHQQHINLSSIGLAQGIAQHAYYPTFPVVYHPHAGAIPIIHQTATAAAPATINGLAGSSQSSMSMSHNTNQHAPIFTPNGNVSAITGGAGSQQQLQNGATQNQSGGVQLVSSQT
jgi:hypothetical protein